jgi:hypothetical protein
VCPSRSPSTRTSRPSRPCPAGDPRARTARLRMRPDPRCDRPAARTRHSWAFPVDRSRAQPSCPRKAGGSHPRLGRGWIRVLCFAIAGDIGRRTAKTMRGFVRPARREPRCRSRSPQSTGRVRWSCVCRSGRRVSTVWQARRHRSKSGARCPMRTITRAAACRSSRRTDRRRPRRSTGGDPHRSEGVFERVEIRRRRAALGSWIS